MAKEKKFRELERFSANSWIDVENPNEDELDELHVKFGLDIDLMNDALDPHEVPRLEVSEGVVYLYARMPHKSGEKIVTVPVLIALGKNFVATICKNSVPFSTGLIKSNSRVTPRKRIDFFLALLVEIDALFTQSLNRISRSIRSISVQIEDISNRQIIRFVNFEGIVNDLLAALVPMSVTIQKLLFQKSLKLSPEQRDTIEDLLLSNRELQELSKTNLRSIVNIREGYSTIMTNNLNRVIKILTVITIVLTIPTIVSSMYGMNVPLPLSDSPYSFWFVLGGTFAVAGIVLLVMRGNKWL